MSEAQRMVEVIEALTVDFTTQSPERRVQDLL